MHIDNIAKALGRIPSGLYVVTSGPFEGRTSAFLASFVQQVSIAEPRLIVGVGKDRPMRELIEQCGQLCVHILSEGQNKVLSRYAKGFAKGEQAFEGEAIIDGPNGLPLIEDLTVRIICRVREIIDIEADHDLVICDVVEAHFPEGLELPKSWIHLRKNGRGY